MQTKPQVIRFLTMVAMGSLFAACPRGGAGGGGASADPKTDDEKVFYALGLDIGKNVEVFAMSPAEVEFVKSGLGDAIAKRTPKVELDKIRPKIFEMAKKRQDLKSVAEKQKGKDTVAKAAKEAGAEQLPSGVVVKTLRAGTGDSPADSDTVKVNYEGRLADGTVFDSSYKRNQPAQFPLHGVVKCWTEGLQKMKIGGKAQLTCPSEVAYGDQGRPPTIPGGATLIFDIELLEITKPEPPKPAAPAAMSEPGKPGAPGAKPMMMAPKPGAPGAKPMMVKPAAPAAATTTKPAATPPPGTH
ncbi:MAG TPA: FKBP-type peptidyl-prolyl cis-trans isomerase [Polyangia bacterium]|jgi:FKBP-type peptidyl-prolyl cis-trans isomerase FkpA